MSFFRSQLISEFFGDYRKIALDQQQLANRLQNKRDNLCNQHLANRQLKYIGTIFLINRTSKNVNTR